MGSRAPLPREIATVKTAVHFYRRIPKGKHRVNTSILSSSRSRLSQRGMAVIVVLALVSILLIYAACNIKTLANLGRELRLLEQQQVRRLQSSAPATNTVSLA